MYTTCFSKLMYNYFSYPKLETIVPQVLSLFGLIPFQVSVRNKFVSVPYKVEISDHLPGHLTLDVSSVVILVSVLVQ